MNEIKYFVYGLYVQGEQKPFYIGKSNNRYGENKRFTCHIQDAKEGNKELVYNKIRKLLRENVSFYERKIKYFKTDREAIDLEIKLIHLLGKVCVGTGCLYNISDGGDGVCGIKMSEEAKENLRKKHLGMKASLATRKRMSESHKKIPPVWIMGKRHSKEVIEKIAAKNRGKKMSKEVLLHLQKKRRERYGWTEEITTEALKLYEIEKLSFTEIAKRLGRKWGSIRNMLKSKGITPKKFINYDDIDMEKVKSFYTNEYLTLSEIIKKLDLKLSPASLANKLKSLGVVLRTPSESMKKRSFKARLKPEIIEAWVEAIRGGESYRSLSKRYSISFTTIADIVKPYLSKVSP